MGENESAQAPSILVVEDEPMLLMVAVETLRDAGYDVREAGNGQRAMEILETEPDIDLLITDIKMPGMNGFQLAEAGLALRPGLHVLLMTGYAQDPVPKKISDAGIRILYKPFDIDRLPVMAGEILAAASN